LLMREMLGQGAVLLDQFVQPCLCDLPALGLVGSTAWNSHTSSAWAVRTSAGWRLGPRLIPLGRAARAEFGAGHVGGLGPLVRAAWTNANAVWLILIGGFGTPQKRSAFSVTAACHCLSR
jgi:hypothetical protein